MADATHERAAETRSDEEHATHGPGTLALWTGVLLPPIVFLATLELSYVLVQWGCQRDTQAPLHLTAAGTVLVALVLAAFAIRTWRRVGDWPAEVGGYPSRARFLAALGVLTSALFVLVVVAQWVPVFVLSPCLKA